MGNLHQHLAALNELEAQDRKVQDETAAVWKKQELFDAFTRVLHMKDEDRKHEEAGAAEERALTTTAIERIVYTVGFMIPNLDAQIQREVANTVARADLVIPNGKVIKDCPITAIMHMEKYFNRFRQVIDGAPTLDTTKRWIKDAQAALEGVMRTEEPERANKTEKQKVVISMAKATEKHPEQVSLHDKDVVVGYYEKDYQTGKLTPAAKHAALKYIDAVILALRKAKAQANETVVDSSLKHAKLITDGLLEAIRGAM